MKRGLFRLELPGLGECARAHLLAGDAAPYLERGAYEALGFLPPFDALPSEAEYWSLPADIRTQPKRYDVYWKAARATV